MCDSLTCCGAEMIATKVLVVGKRKKHLACFVVLIICMRNKSFLCNLLCCVFVVKVGLYSHIKEAIITRFSCIQVVNMLLFDVFAGIGHKYDQFSSCVLHEVYDQLLFAFHMISRDHTRFHQKAINVLFYLFTVCWFSNSIEN